MKAEIIQK